MPVDCLLLLIHRHLLLSRHWSNHRGWLCRIRRCLIVVGCWWLLAINRGLSVGRRLAISECGRLLRIVLGRLIRKWIHWGCSWLPASNDQLGPGVVSMATMIVPAATIF